MDIMTGIVIIIAIVAATFITALYLIDCKDKK